MFNKILFIRYFGPIFGGLSLLTLFLGLGFTGIIGAFFLSLAITVFSIGFAGKIGGSVANGIYATGRKPLHIIDKFHGELDQLRFLKRNQEFSKALIRVDRLLETVPEFTEALYLKAEILWEGYGNHRETIKCLREVLRLADTDEVIYRWAMTMLDEIS